MFFRHYRCIMEENIIKVNDADILGYFRIFYKDSRMLQPNQRLFILFLIVTQQCMGGKNSDISIYRWWFMQQNHVINRIFPLLIYNRCLVNDTWGFFVVFNFSFETILRPDLNFTVFRYFYSVWWQWLLQARKTKGNECGGEKSSWYNWLRVSWFFIFIDK